ncbi:uncharacterized protein LOC128557055 [Mercenaria mercenaria]|uniref:uncharacterized protein LOC128557055 n=1 Tax=Mercenaria mercenaria TaxID=6596 RepID=UPI00234F9588|nr:uncharacterized protein LOC128557055 [Mercenaria mercenaria]
MKNVTFMAAHDLPNSIMADLIDLCKEQGASHLKALQCDDHTTYQHNTSVAEFQQATEVITDELINAVNMSPYFSVTLDEPTDISVKQNLIVYTVYFAQEKGKMVQKSNFLGLVHLDHGATAQNIFDALIDILTKRGIDCSIYVKQCFVDCTVTVM